MYRSSRLLFILPSKKVWTGRSRSSELGLPVLAWPHVTDELFPRGTGAVIAKDLSRKSIAESAVPVLRDGQHAALLGRASLARVTRSF